MGIGTDPNRENMKTPYWKEAEMQWEIECVEKIIENEIIQGCNQRQIAQTYALALLSTWSTDWAKVNAMILAKWPKGLTRIKEMARR